MNIERLHWPERDHTVTAEKFINDLYLSAVGLVRGSDPMLSAYEIYAPVLLENLYFQVHAENAIVARSMMDDKAIIKGFREGLRKGSIMLFGRIPREAQSPVMDESYLQSIVSQPVQLLRSGRIYMEQGKVIVECAADDIELGGTGLWELSQEDLLTDTGFMAATDLVARTLGF